jgi:hypothetical protein
MVIYVVCGLFISDYLYRVLASNDAGTGLSQWVYGKTKEGGKFWLSFLKEDMLCL